MLDRDTLDLILIATSLALAASTIYLLVSQRNFAKQRNLELTQSQKAAKRMAGQLEEAESRLERLSIIDPLTELVNRRGLERILAIEVNRAQRGGSPMVAMLLNCDDFKRINESLGHAVGDVALKEMVERITNTLRPSDYVARIGGDEFVIILTDTQLAEAMLIAERVRMAVSESPIRHSSENIYMTASLGVALLPYEISSAEELISLTRHALKQSKSLGKNRVSTSEVQVGSNGESEVEATDIVKMLRHGDCFRCVKHPMYRLEDETKIGYELLTRGPVGAFEMPYDFFHVAIENNILTRVDLRCLKTCIDASEVLEKNIRFDVNLFPSTIIDTPVDRLLAMFPTNCPPGTFCVEISEQQFIGDPGYLKENTNALKKAGVLVGIDDVGFGRSSLESLILLEPDVVKVDIKYVSGISLDPHKQRLLRRLIKVVEALGAELVAEGIQSRDDLEMLKSMGVKYGQGFLWGWPSLV
jgi:diguanylate cyclase (GGDEF)-like protein